MITKKNYKMNERTEAQFLAMELKKKGYHVTRIVIPDGAGSVEVIAFGYSLPYSIGVKEIKEIDARVAKEEDYDFIYWN